MNPENTGQPCSRDELEKLHLKPGLSQRIRYLASIEALVALGFERRLHQVFDLALDNGISLPEIHEIMLQACIFCGYPRTINGFALLRKCLRERGRDQCNGVNKTLDKRTNEELDRMGHDLFCRIYRFNHEEVLNDLRTDHPELPGWILRDVYGKTLCRPALDPKTRELAAVAALTVMKVFPQLLSHIKGGLNLGADKREVEEVILQMNAYTSRDTVRRGLRFLKLGTRVAEHTAPEGNPRSPKMPEAS